MIPPMLLNINRQVSPAQCNNAVYRYVMAVNLNYLSFISDKFLSTSLVWQMAIIYQCASASTDLGKKTGRGQNSEL